MNKLTEEIRKFSKDFNFPPSTKAAFESFIQQALTTQMETLIKEVEKLKVKKDEDLFTDEDHDYNDILDQVKELIKKI